VRLIRSIIVALTLVAAGCTGSNSDTSASSESSEATQVVAVKESESEKSEGDFAGLVDIGGGREMYLECRGTGSPTVVLVSGFRGSNDDWTNVVDPDDSASAPKPSDSAVFPEVSSFTRVCAYDRPGTTYTDGTPTTSTPVPQPTSAQDGTADLHALLTAAEEPGPYVIVAHSWGGLIGYLFASDYPDAVSGLVLIDPGSEFLQTELTTEQWATFVQAAKQLGDPEDLEAADYESSVDALCAAPPVGAIPAVVLTSDKPFDFGAGEEGTWPAWLSAQERLATLLGAKHITDTNSGHYIAGEQPQLVIDAIRQVVDAERADGEAGDVVKGAE
jgi:pimeloyl-ACP methyl ester carboxylesterase